MSADQDCFGADDFQKGLKSLDDEMGQDEWLIAFAPISLLSAGGFLAVSFFRNRESTGDLDYLVEPQWAHDNDIKGPLRKAMQRAAINMGFIQDWANDEMAFFVSDQSRQLLFEEAEKQNIILWDGPNLRVLAVPLEWALERKLRRIHNKMQKTKRESDINDAIAILRFMRERNGGPLNKEHVRTLNICSEEPPPDHRTMDEVATAYRRKYGEEPF